jgi:hypothetical protein
LYKKNLKHEKNSTKISNVTLSFDLMKIRRKKLGRPGIEPGAVEWQTCTLPLDHHFKLQNEQKMRDKIYLDRWN